LTYLEQHRFVSEIESISQLKHKHAIRIYHV